MNLFSHIALILTIAYPGYLRAVEPGRCQAASLTLKYTLGRNTQPPLTAQESAHLQKWAAEHHIASSGYPNLPPNLGTHVLGKLPNSTLTKLLFDGDWSLTEGQVQKRLASLPVSWGAFSRMFRSNAGEKYISDRLLKEIISSRTSTARDITAKEVDRRVRLSVLEKKLSSKYANEYEIVIGREEITLPDGVPYKIVNRFPDGTITFLIPFSRFLKTEDYRSHNDRIPYYRNEIKANPQAFEKGVMNVKSPRSLGSVTADGRFFILDGHARSEAYGQLHNGQVLVDIQPATNGKYYAMTHYEILSFYGRWSAVPLEVKWGMEKMVDRSLLRAIQDVYYQHMGLQRLRGVP